MNAPLEVVFTSYLPDRKAWRRFLGTPRSDVPDPIIPAKDVGSLLHGEPQDLLFGGLSRRTRKGSEERKVLGSVQYLFCTTPTLFIALKTRAWGPGRAGNLNHVPYHHQIRDLDREDLI